ncbi:hypothetical protein [Streptomyces sp. NPDC001594]|uniref:hypothetical protein n=1 Tax=Streptomyces sp. NPDC001594 TaxID=3364590 RepID=UPI0036CDF901
MADKWQNPQNPEGRDDPTQHWGMGPYTAPDKSKPAESDTAKQARTDDEDEDEDED